MSTFLFIWPRVLIVLTDLKIDRYLMVLVSKYCQKIAEDPKVPEKRKKIVLCNKQSVGFEPATSRLVKSFLF